jgi:hypothetical protein
MVGVGARRDSDCRAARARVVRAHHPRRAGSGYKTVMVHGSMDAPSQGSRSRPSDLPGAPSPEVRNRAAEPLNNRRWSNPFARAKRAIDAPVEAHASPGKGEGTAVPWTTDR